MYPSAALYTCAVNSNAVSYTPRSISGVRLATNSSTCGIDTLTPFQVTAFTSVTRHAGRIVPVQGEYWYSRSTQRSGHRVRSLRWRTRLPMTQCENTALHCSRVVGAARIPGRAPTSVIRRSRLVSSSCRRAYCALASRRHVLLQSPGRCCCTLSTLAADSCRVSSNLSAGESSMLSRPQRADRCASKTPNGRCTDTGRLFGSASFRRFSWSRWSDSNRRPAVYETAALPLSYTGLRSPRRDSNPGPQSYQDCALPPELRGPRLDAPASIADSRPPCNSGRPTLHPHPLRLPPTGLLDSFDPRTALPTRFVASISQPAYDASSNAPPGKEIVTYHSVHRPTLPGGHAALARALS